MKNLIIVTGGAGFVGSNLIRLLLKKTNKEIISYDNYSSGTKKNHIISKRVRYIKADTLDIEKKYFHTKTKFILFFTLGNLQEYFKVSTNLKNAINQIPWVQTQFLNFV